MTHFVPTRRSSDLWRFPIEAPPPSRRGARRFDAGELDEPLPLAMAAAGLEQVLAWGVPGIAAALGERTRALDDALDANGLSTWKTPGHAPHLTALRSEEHTSELQSLMRISYAVFCLKKKNKHTKSTTLTPTINPYHSNT